MTTAEEFRVFGKAMIDYVADYLENIRDRPVMPDVKPGYLQPLIPKEAPQKPEQWQDVMKDIERVIMPGVVHWHSPRFNAYFAAANSYPAIVADILSDGLTSIGFTWASNPACTELEMAMMDWLGKMLNLPQDFLFEGVCAGGERSRGGGVIQGSASESSLVALLTARSRKLKHMKNNNPDCKDEDEGSIMQRLVAYTSSVSHSSAQRAAMLGGVKIRLLEPDEDNSLRGAALAAAIREDRKQGLIPFFYIATLGTTSCCSFDNILELGPICQKENVWMHIDAAYAGSAFICPEYRPILNGVEFADSFNFNPHKWLLINHDCSAMWLKDREEIEGAFNVDPTYLQHEYQGQIPDYRHWQIPLGRRFRSLKLWFVMRLYGQEGLRQYIRHHISLAHQFESLVEADDRFEITTPVTLGLVCFRLRGPNKWNEVLIARVNENGKIHITPSKIRGTFFLRFAICARTTEVEDIYLAWQEISLLASEVTAQFQQAKERRVSYASCIVDSCENCILNRRR